MESPDKLTFGSYEVLQNPDGTPCVLGEGSFGITYKARHSLLGRISALKVIREELLNRGSKQDHEETKRFLREARAVGRLSHPSIASVFDCALDNGVFYYAMEFCDGGTLKEWCRENGPMSWHELRKIACQIASALDCAHESGLIHRDIKPSNIMLTGEGKFRTAKLIDFGLAQDLSADTDSSVSASSWKQVNFGGNLATASPEQILGKNINPQSDLFSLGVTLWWLLLGRSPFRGISRGMIVSDRINSMSYAASLPKDLDPEACDLLVALLEKDVNKRLLSAHALMSLLAVDQSSCSSTIPVVDHEPLEQPPDFEEAYRLEGVLSAASQVKLYSGIDLIERTPVTAVLPNQSINPRSLGGMRIACHRRLDFSAYAFLDWRFSGGGDVFVLSKPEGCNLLAILRKLGPARFEEALPLLSHLAHSFDASIAWTTFGIRLDPGEILVKTPEGNANIESFKTWRDINPASICSLPQFSPEPSLPSTSATTLLSLADFSPLAQFAALIYQVLVGSAMRYAAFFTTDGYVKSHRLSEGGNSLLAAMLCKSETDASATDFLMMLADAESVILREYPPRIEFPTPSEIERGKLPPISSELGTVSDGTRGLAGESFKPQVPAGLDTQPHKLTAAEVEKARIQSDEHEEARMEFERFRVLEVLRRKDEAKARRLAEKEARHREIALRVDLNNDIIPPTEESSSKLEKLELELARKKKESLEIEAKLVQTRLEMAGKQPQESAQQPSAAAIPAMQSAPAAAPSQAPPSIGSKLTESTAKSGRQPIIFAAIAAGVILWLAFVSWWFISHTAEPPKVVENPVQKPEIRRKPTREPPPVTKTPDKPDPKPETISEPQPIQATPAVAVSLSKVKVPGDAATIGKAIELCKEGGTIEISGGTYREAIQLNKSISLVADPSAVLENDKSNVIVASGPIKVTLRNLQIKNSSDEAKKSAFDSPALVLIYGGAAVHIEGCMLEKSNGDGVSVVKKASAEISNSQIRDNRGYGVNVRDASKVEMSISGIRKNGSGGIAIMNGGSKGTLGNGTIIAENSKNGVEVGYGASLECKRVTITQNKKTGLVLEVSGSKAILDACVISENEHGIGVSKSASLVLSNSKLEGNKEDGLFVESSGKVEIDVCEFKSNGTIGAYMVNGRSSTMRISKSVFSSHPDAAVAAVEGGTDVSGCRFSDNKTAIFYGEKSNGIARGNRIHPGPLKDVLFLENAGDVRLENNTIDPP